MTPGFAAFVVTLCLAAPAPAATDIETARALARWQAMRFGMFIHWGPVSLKGTEIGWSRGKEVPVEEYDQLYRASTRYASTPTPGRELARDAGMRYSSSPRSTTTASASGPRKLTDYDIGNTPFGRDVVRELADACRSHGIVLLHLPFDLRLAAPRLPARQPRRQDRGSRTPNMDRYSSSTSEGQVAELLERYGPLGRPVVRRRVGGAVDGGARDRPLRRADGPAAAPPRQQPRGKGRQDMAGVTLDRGLARRLRHARAARSARFQTRPPVGDLHHPLQAVGVEARRRR